MAVSIDSVYQTVLAIANKEQRGYITPLEFNLLANQAQMIIFEQYFYDLEKMMRAPGNDTVHADRVDIIEEKINHFIVPLATPTGGGSGIWTLPSDLYRLSNVYYGASFPRINITEAKAKDINRLMRLPLTKSEYYYVRELNKINVYPTTTTSNVKIEYIKKPADVYWAYVVVPNAQGGNEYPLHDSSTTVNFELHESEENTLINKILELAGVVMKQADVVGFAEKKDIQETQKEIS